MPAAALGTAIWGGLAIAYILLLATLGLTTLRKGHSVLFILGIVLPFLWLIGALIAPVEDSGVERDGQP